MNGSVTLERPINRYKRTQNQRDVITLGRILTEKLTVAQRVMHLPGFFWNPNIHYLLYNSFRF
jgi:hypothetical protein